MAGPISYHNHFNAKSLRLEIPKAPTVSFFLTSASLPGLSSSAVPVPASVVNDTKVHGDNLIYNPLTVNFILDENLENWFELFNWMSSYTTPLTSEQYKNGNVGKRLLHADKYCDMTLFVPNSKYNTTRRITFEHAFPVELGEVFIDSQVDNTTSMVCTATFEYTVFRPEPLIPLPL